MKRNKKGNRGGKNVSSAASAWGSPVGTSFIQKGGDRGGKIVFNSTISTTAKDTNKTMETDDQNKKLLNELAHARKKDSTLEGGYSMEKSSLGPKQLFLLNQFMGFDKFTGMEREDLVDLMVNEWMADPYVGNDYRQHVELYCESSFSIDRRTSEREFPNRLNTAVCCDMLQMIARKDTKYRRALKLVKAGIFASIFSDYQEADESGRTFLEMTPFYTISKNQKNKSEADNRKEYHKTKAKIRDKEINRTEEERREMDEEMRRAQQETSVNPEMRNQENPGELLSRLLFELDPEDVADIIEYAAGRKYRQAVVRRWAELQTDGGSNMKNVALAPSVGMLSTDA
jgi:hypothetical protein